MLIDTFDEHGALHVFTFDGGSSSDRVDFLFWPTLPGISCIKEKPSLLASVSDSSLMIAEASLLLLKLSRS